MRLSLYYPVKPRGVNQGFGENQNPFYHKLGMKGHNGIDFFAIDNQIVRAAHEGVVTFTGEDGSGGDGVVVRTTEIFDYGIDKTYFKSIYWHLVRGGFLVKSGEKVHAGTPLGYADNTGMSTGTHLHFGLKPIYQGEQDWQWYNTEQNNGYLGAIDPQPFFNGIFAEDYYNQTVSLYERLVRTLQQMVELLKPKK